MDRKAMIKRLVEDDIEGIRDAMRSNDIDYLEYILLDGVGYNKMSDDGLIEQFNNRTWEIEMGYVQDVPATFNLGENV
jgi:hypothetical protein